MANQCVMSSVVFSAKTRATAATAATMPRVIQVDARLARGSAATGVVSMAASKRDPADDYKSRAAAISSSMSGSSLGS